MSDTKNAKPEPDARVEEAKAPDGMVEVEFKGGKYVIPRSFKDWPYLYTFEMERGHSALAFQHLLGEAQFARFVETRPTNGDFGAFDEMLGKALGVKQGESDASSA